MALLLQYINSSFPYEITALLIDRKSTLSKPTKSIYNSSFAIDIPTWSAYSSFLAEENLTTSY